MTEPTQITDAKKCPRCRLSDLHRDGYCPRVDCQGAELARLRDLSRWRRYSDEKPPNDTAVILAVPEGCIIERYSADYWVRGHRCYPAHATDLWCPLPPLPEVKP